MSKHCFFAPSEGHIWVNCPYMLRLKYLYERELEKPAGIEAQRGTLMHEYVARILNYMQKKYFHEQIKKEHFDIIDKYIIQSGVGKYEGDKKDLDIIVGQNKAYHDVGKVNDQYFMYILAIGAGSASSYTTNQDVKKILGRIAYVREILKEFNIISNNSEKYIHIYVCMCVSTGIWDFYQIFL